MAAVSVVGKLNALTAGGTEAFTAEHMQIKEELFDVLASVTRVADRFVPPGQPEENE